VRGDGAFAEAVIRSVELIVQAERPSVAHNGTCAHETAGAQSQAAVQAACNQNASAASYGLGRVLINARCPLSWAKRT
jgi:hypothetical protein